MARSVCNEEPVTRIVSVGWHKRFVGIPFADGGRDPRGCDCWGLVRLIYAEVLGIELPSYGDVSAKDLIKVARNIGAGYDLEPWFNVQKPRALDVVVMRFHGSSIVGHVGVAVDEKTLLHTEKSMDSAVVPINHWTIKQRVHCFRRYR